MDGEALGRIGERYVASIIDRIGHGWRNQSEKSEFIDGIIEVREKGRLSGKFINVQIKSGRSYLLGYRKGMYSVRIDPKLADYFLEAKSPSIYVWYDDECRKAFWSEVHHSNLTPKKHRIRIPKKQSLGLHSSGDLVDITRRWWGIEENLPRLECITIPRVRVSDVKQSARDFYDEWRNEHFVSSAFGHVNITLKGWRHLTMASRPQQHIVRRLALLGYAREILKSIPIYHVCRRDEERGVSYCMQTAMVIEKTRANAVVSVITEVPDKGMPTFYSVFEHRSRGGSGEPVPRGLLGATAR